MRVFIFVVLVAIPLWAKAAVNQEFARKLVELRAEVEDAGNAYEESLQKRKAALDPLQMRNSEMEAQVAKEELRASQLKEKLKATKGIPMRSTSREEEWQGLAQWASLLSGYVDSGLPFRLKERRERVKGIEERVKQKRESPIAVAVDLWAITEKELLLTKGVEYRIAKLALPDGEVDAELARLGMAHMLFLGASGSAGYSSRKNGKWELTLAKNEAEKASIDRLVTRLKAKSTNGWYEVPGLESIPRGEAE